MIFVTNIIAPLSELVKSIAVFLTVLIAYRGLTSWQEQQIGKRRFEVAEETLTAFYKAKDVKSYARNPVWYSNEGRTLELKEGETDSVSAIKMSYFIAIERLSHETDVLARMQTLRHLCKAYFGNEIDESFKELSDVLGQIHSASRMLIMTATQDCDRPDRMERREKWEDAIWDTFKDMNKAITRVERICTPHLSPKRRARSA